MEYLRALADLNCLQIRVGRAHADSQLLINAYTEREARCVAAPFVLVCAPPPLVCTTDCQSFVRPACGCLSASGGAVRCGGRVAWLCAWRDAVFHMTVGAGRCSVCVVCDGLLLLALASLWR
jgi:hypothetical protein